MDGRIHVATSRWHHRAAWWILTPVRAGCGEISGRILLLVFVLEFYFILLFVCVVGGAKRCNFIRQVTAPVSAVALLGWQY